MTANHQIKKTRVIGVADLIISKDQDDLLITYSLGSCLGLSLYDPSIKAGGILHCMLPLSKIDTEKAKINPYMFTDTGVFKFLQTMFELGASRSSLIAKVAGCSKILDEKNMFNIGERNYTVLRKILWKNDILITSEHIGGNISRTMKLDMKTGITTLKIQGEEITL